MPSRRVLAAVVLAAARCATASAEPAAMADSVALVQQRALATEPAAASDDLPKLHCDMEVGCRYEGLPPPQKKPEQPLALPFAIPGIDLDKVKEAMSHTPDLAKMAGDLAKLFPKPAPAAPQAPPQMPDFAKMMKDAAKLMPPPASGAPQAPPQMPDFAKMMKDAAKLLPTPAPNGQQMPDLMKMMQEAAKHMAPPAAPAVQQPAPTQAAPQMPDLAKLAQGLKALMPPAAGAQAAPAAASPPAFPMPDLSKLGKEILAKMSGGGVSALQVGAVASEETELAHFMPDNGMVCCQGSPSYIEAAIAKLKVSPLGPGYEKAQARAGACSTDGYDLGPKPDKCLPGMSLYMSKDHDLQPFSEIRLMWKYSRQHGDAATKEAMGRLCDA